MDFKWIKQLRDMMKVCVAREWFFKIKQGDKKNYENKFVKATYKLRMF